MGNVDLDALFGGESDCIEYKVTRPKDAKSYLKTVVAFANGHGGRLVFGVDDKTHEVAGIPAEEVPQEMDAIANALGDACTPTIVPGIYELRIWGDTPRRVRSYSEHDVRGVSPILNSTCILVHWRLWTPLAIVDIYSSNRLGR